jgi:hypothetical protein
MKFMSGLFAAGRTVGETDGVPKRHEVVRWDIGKSRVGVVSANRKNGVILNMNRGIPRIKWGKQPGIGAMVIKCGNQFARYIWDLRWVV